LRHFFLSYSPGDDDLYVARFFLDLSAAVRRELGAGSDRDVGFLDQGNANDHWPSEIRNELATCQTLVVLCSPKLFLDERCGRVWSVFSDRLRAYESATGRGAPALIPVPWSSRDLPVVDGGVDPATLPSPDEDLRVLIRLHSYRRAYQEFVGRLARQVVETTRAHRIPQATPGVDLREAQNAFEGWQQRQRGHRGPQYVHFVIAAGTREEMRVVRHDVGFYGQRPEDWAPFHPALAQSLAARAREIAAERLFGSEVVPIGAVGDQVALAQERNEIVVLLLDSWVLRLESFRRMLAAFDQVEESAVAVLVPASREDAETSEERKKLHGGVLRAFPHCARRRDALLRTEIETPNRFDDDLAAALEEAQNRIFAKGRIFRRPADGPANARPILEGP
jgi:FxsC-like protein